VRDRRHDEVISVVIPFSSAASENRGPCAFSISVSERTMTVGERCTIVTSAPCSHRSAAMSCAELFEPITTQRLPA
jgi:hypothetical protein